MGRRRGTGTSFSLLAVGVWLAAASCSNGEMPKVGGAAGSNGGPGAAGSNTTGSNTGNAGNQGGGTGAAGDNGGGTGAAGDNGGGTGAAGDNGGTGAGGSGAGGSGTGTGGSSPTGVGGTTGNGGAIGAAGAGAAGATGTGGSAGGGKGPTGMSAGCGMGAMDPSGKFTHHTIAVTGIASTVKPATAGASWTMRDYYIQVPANYDPTKPYPVLFGGGGCGGSLVTNGSGGGFAVLGGSQSQAIQIGLSYVWAMGGGACFDDNGADTPDLPYFDAVLAEVEKNYCVDKGKVFVGGYSSGGWEAYMLGLARGGVVRGISPAAGGLRMSRPPGSNIPIAALLLTGGDDTANPATGPTGSDAAMSLILQINGCQGTATVPWETTCTGCGCNRYTGCPAAFPVVRCRPPGQGHTDGGGAFKTAIWATWMSLPTPP
jgi:poly(3-hydroxybutyrate) depolymerase